MSTAWSDPIAYELLEEIPHVHISARQRCILEANRHYTHYTHQAQKATIDAILYPNKLVRALQNTLVASCHQLQP